MFSDRFTNRRVLVTGHTGFKGSWLAHWLTLLGAEVSGLSLDPEPHETLFGSLALQSRIVEDHRCDIRDQAKVLEIVREIRPEFVFHLAAQPLVRKSYECPVETFATNVLGTIHVLDAIRLAENACTVIAVTTDKCYENREWVHSYREEDAMGGYDPYSASKGCAELAISSYRRSFFSHPQSRIKLASARAGNVIGGGDWAVDRIVPDVFRALFENRDVQVRNKSATRPWQHVLEPLSGYLWLAACIDNPELTRSSPSALMSAFNFGPRLESNRTVYDVVKNMLEFTGGNWVDKSDPFAPHEASKLNLAIDKAYHFLGWLPTWQFAETIARTSAWYMEAKRGADVVDLTTRQIFDFQQKAFELGLAWAR